MIKFNAMKTIPQFLLSDVGYISITPDAALSSFFDPFLRFLSDWGSFAFKSLQKDLNRVARFPFL